MILRMVKIFIFTLATTLTLPLLAANGNTIVHKLDINRCRTLAGVELQQYQYVVEVVKRLSAADPKIKAMRIKLSIVQCKARVLNAETEDNDGPALQSAKITITTDMIKFVSSNINWLAMILGHELNHAKNGDIFPDTERSDFCQSSTQASRQCEHDADIGGQVTANAAGYDGCQAASLFSYWLKAMGHDIPDDSDHPTMASRIKYLTCGK